MSVGTPPQTCPPTVGTPPRNIGGPSSSPLVSPCVSPQSGANERLPKNFKVQQQNFSQTLQRHLNNGMKLNKSLELELIADVCDQMFRTT